MTARSLAHLAVVIAAATAIGTAPRPAAAQVRSQGDFQRLDPSMPDYAPGGLNAALARERFGVDGSGVTVGVISDSFDRLYCLLFDPSTGCRPPTPFVDDAISTGELPGSFDAANDILADAFFGVDEGRALAEVVHDLAPGARIKFHAADGNDDASIGAAIDALAAAGCDIILDDAPNARAPMFQDGHAARAVDRAILSGIVYVSAAGNWGSNGWIGRFTRTEPTRSDPSPDPLVHDFDPGGGGNGELDVLVEAGNSITVHLQWDDPFPSLDDTPVSRDDLADYDLELLDADGVLIRASRRRQTDGAGTTLGLDPIETVSSPTLLADSTLRLRIVKRDAAQPDRALRLLVITTGRDVDTGELRARITDPDRTDGPTLTGQNAARDAIAVAALRYNTGLVTGFSGRGDVEIRLAPDGTRLASPEPRPKPSVAASTRVDNSFYPDFTGFGDSDFEQNGAPNLTGTSGATPHAAAVVALMLDLADRRFGYRPTPLELRRALESSATTSGADRIAEGAGLVDAIGAIALTPCGPADLAAPFGIISFADAARFVELYLSADRQPAALAEPTDEATPADIGAFIDRFFAACG